MESITPINLNNGTIHIHGMRKMDMERLNSIENDVFEILNNIENIEFIPERQILSKEDASKIVLGVTMGYAMKTRWTHFLSLVKFNYKVVGQIDVLGPGLVYKNYGIKDTWLLEYYLHKQLWGNGIMTGALNAIIDNLKEQGIKKIGALCQTNNLGSVAVLKKIGFTDMGEFDAKQNFYLLK